MCAGIVSSIASASRSRHLTWPRRTIADTPSWLAELTAGSGCTEEEILAHGNKVRAYIYFAQERLKREGHLDQLKGKEKYAYQLPPVIPRSSVRRPARVSQSRG